MLKSLDLSPVYDSAERNLIKELFIPLLKSSNEYWRGVGYFSSGWLKLTAAGIEKLAASGGTARFVTSPLLSSEDISAFRLAAEAQKNQVLYNVLKRSLYDISTSLESDTLNTLAWMLADGIIEFKFAIPRIGVEGDYHDKVGVFADIYNDFVAIHGSFNDTYKGSLNGEAFSVFKSWDTGQNVFAQKHFSRLKELWKNGNSQFEVFHFEEALKRDFVNMRISARPYSIDKLQESNSTNPFITLSNTNEPRNPFELKPYQKDALQAWFNNNYSGIFEMATGTGKTITSIAAAIELFNKQGKLFLVIIVPFLHLLEQWKDNCSKFNIDVLCCSGNNPDWPSKLKSKIVSFKIGSIQLACVAVVKDTAAEDKFRKYAEEIPGAYFMMIADETHYLGAKYLRNALFPKANFRLGLSATPNRWMDEEGTDVLKNYYRDVVYQFSLETAISQKFLTEYEYYPILVEFTQDELAEYTYITGEILKLICQKESFPEDIVEIQKDLDRALRERAILIGKAENKFVAYKQLLIELKKQSETGRLSHLLTFCAPGTHKEILKITSREDVRCHEFVHEVSYKNRKAVLEAFTLGHIEALISIKCMDEGVDIPATKTAILLASTTNPKEFIQRRGRVLRTFQGKPFAVIYDFIVIPPEGTDNEIASSIIRRELPRFAEFSDIAKNKYFSRKIILPILEKYNLQAFIDEKPWSIYKKDIENSEV